MITLIYLTQTGTQETQTIGALQTVGVAMVLLAVAVVVVLAVAVVAQVMTPIFHTHIIMTIEIINLIHI
jgi:hypothetical protein